MSKSCKQNGIRYDPRIKLLQVLIIGVLVFTLTGKNSGWMYRVNGKFPNYMAGKCKLHDGDKVEWLYTCVRGDL